MAITKIPCGGFSYDDTEIAFENGVIHPIGSDVFAVTFMPNGDNIVCDKSYDEIKQAVESGKFIYGIFLEGDYRTPLIFDLIEPTEEHGSAVFHQMSVSDGTLEGINIIYFTDGHTELEEILYRLTPAND